jgi:general secretion pathway protein D
VRKTICLIIFALILWGCAAFSPSYRQGTQAAMNRNWDEAIHHLEKAALEDPDNSVYRIALIRAKLAASYDHLNQARELASHGKKEESLAEYRKALSYGQLGSDIVEEARRLAEEKPEEEKPREVKIEPPVRLVVSDEKIVLRFPVEVNLRSIYQALGKHARINIIFDEQFRDAPFSIELVDMSFEQALYYLCMASKNFYRIVDEKTVVVAPDLPQKRAQYELNAIKTFYLSNINAEEIRAQFMQILRTSMGRAPILITDKNLNSVTIRDAPEVLELAERLIQLWDKPKGEIILDLEIMEVSRIRLKQLGVELQTELGENYMGIRYRGVDTEDEGWQSLKDLDFTKAENFQVSLPAAILQFLESDADTKIISQPKLRGIDGEEMTYLVGDKIPIPRTTFTPIAAGGISQQPVTNFTFEDVGIDVKITPRIHIEREVTLELEIKIKSIGGTGFANIPIIATREVKNVIRLKDGETNLLAGLLKDEERKIHSGIVGLKNIPILGGLFSSTDQTVQQTDVILTITPHIIRTIPLSEEDMKPLWVGLESVTPTGERAEVPPEEAIRTQRQVLREEAMTARAGQNQIMLSPPNVEARQNREVRINVNLRIQEDISNMSLSISFNPEVISLKEVVRREFINRLGEDVPFFQNIDNSAGVCTLGFSSPEVDKGLRGTGTLAVLVFEPVSQGESDITVTEVSANSPTGESADFTVSRQSRVIVR